VLSLPAGISGTVAYNHALYAFSTFISPLKRLFPDSGAYSAL